MGSGLQCLTFICICCLIRDAITHTNQDENKRLNNERSNPNIPGEGDFYFVEEKTNDDNLKTGRAIPQSAWSKEDKEPTLPFENKTGSQSGDESSIKKFLSYLLNVVHELKEDIFGIKEIVALKKTKELPDPQDDNFENKGKQNEMEGNLDTPKPADLTENTESNQKPTSNYITDYYQKNGIKFTDDEERDDDLENSSDMSDDSSHKPNGGKNMHEVGKNNENAHSFKCMKIKRKPDKYSFEAEKTTAIPTSQITIPDEGVKELPESKEKGKYDDFKKSTTKPAKTIQNQSQASSEKTESGTTSPPSSKTGKCRKKTNKNSANILNEKNGPTEKPLKSDEYVTTVSPQNENFDQEGSKISNQNKTVDYRSPGKNSKKKDGSDFENKPDVVVQSTTLSSQSSKDVTFPEDENEPYASGTFSENSTIRKQQEQITSPKPEDQKQTQNNAKSFKDTDLINEHTTVSSQSHKPVGENPQHKMSTEAFTFDTEINNSPKESKGKESTQTTVTYNENEPNSEIDKQQTSSSFDIGNTIAPTTSGNIVNTDKLNKDLSDNLSDKKGTNENDESEKSSSIKQDKNDSETQGDSEPEQTKVQDINDVSEPEKSLKNKMLNDSNPGNNNKEETNNLTTATTSGLQSQNFNREIQNHDIKGSDKPQEAQENNENLNKRAGMQDISPDEEYEYEEDDEDYDISDESDETQDFDENQEGELNTNNGEYEDDDEINPENTGTVLTNESQTSQHTEHVTEEKSQEQYDTFLEYLYKYSNNPYFQSLKNQSDNFSDVSDAY